MTLKYIYDAHFFSRASLAPTELLSGPGGVSVHPPSQDPTSPALFYEV